MPVSFASPSSPSLGIPVPLDLGHVPKPADAEAVELSIERLRDAAPDRCLAHAWRANEAQNLAVHPAPQLADGDELEDTLLDII